MADPKENVSVPAEAQALGANKTPLMKDVRAMSPDAILAGHEADKAAYHAKGDAQNAREVANVEADKARIARGELG